LTIKFVAAARQTQIPQRRETFGGVSVFDLDQCVGVNWNTCLSHDQLEITHVFSPREPAMTGTTIAELDERIAMTRQNISDLIEQAAAYSGAGDESRTADRIAEQEQELAKLIELRDALLSGKTL
jgi:hypothetical protein